MTHLIKCDGCGKISDARVAGWVKCDPTLRSLCDYQRMDDLCPDCWEEVKQMFKTKREVKE